MPLYEFDCHACGERFERLVRPSSGPAAAPVCPSCGSEDLERVISAFAVSSAALRTASIQGARRKLSNSKDRLDRLHTEAEDTREHLREDYGITPAEKPKTLK
jgi:putative FmdB family regulatory protein